MISPPRHALANTKLWSAAFLSAAFFTALGWLENGTPFADDPVVLNDAMVRMAMVRDWLSGQSWFDLSLARLGPGDGTLMHWSRLIDLPIGMLMLLGNALGLDGEWFAVIVWPFLVFVASIAAIMVAARRFSGSGNLVPAVLIGGFALAGTSLFDSGFVDHHNAQLALMLWLTALLTPGGSQPLRDQAFAGLFTALMLAIGMEGLPLAIAGGLAILSRLVSEREAFFPAARAYGLSLALSIAVLFLGLVGPDFYFTPHCDAFSSFHLTCSGAGGIALWFGLNPAVARRVIRPEILVPMVAGGLVLILAGVFFRDCLGDPVGNMDPKLRTFWYDKIGETQNFWQILPVDPWLLAIMHVLPIIALFAGGREIIRRFPGAALNSAMVFLVIAVAISLFQMRGSNFSGPAAATVLAMLVTRFGTGEGRSKPLYFISAVVFTCAFVWRLLFVMLFVIFDVTPGPYLSGTFLGQNASCKTGKVVQTINAEPQGLVAVATAIGPTLLYKTGQRVLSAPYHRNTVGNLAWINAMTGNEADARKIFAETGVTLLAFCPTDTDETKFRTAFPDGLAGQLDRGIVPGWLEPVKVGQTDAMRLYRVKP